MCMIEGGEKGERERKRERETGGEMEKERRETGGEMEKERQGERYLHM